MTFELTMPQQIEEELVLSHLWPAAEYMDAVDGGLEPPSPAKYQESARLALALLIRYGHFPRVNSMVGMSWALGEIAENIRFENKMTG